MKHLIPAALLSIALLMGCAGMKQKQVESITKMTVQWQVQSQLDKHPDVKDGLRKSIKAMRVMALDGASTEALETYAKTEIAKSDLIQADKTYLLNMTVLVKETVESELEARNLTPPEEIQVIVSFLGWIEEAVQ